MTVREVEEKGCVLSPNRYVVYHKAEVKPYAEVKREYLAAVEAVRLAEQRFKEVMGVRSAECGVRSDECDVMKEVEDGK